MANTKAGRRGPQALEVPAGSRHLYSEGPSNSLLRVHDSVDEGKSVGDTQAGHIVPAGGHGQGRICAEAQVHIFAKAPNVPKGAVVLRGRVKRSEQCAGRIVGFSA